MPCLIQPSVVSTRSAKVFQDFRPLVQRIARPPAQQDAGVLGLRVAGPARCTSCVLEFGPGEPVPVWGGHDHPVTEPARSDYVFSINGKTVTYHGVWTHPHASLGACQWKCFVDYVTEAASEAA